MSDFDIYAYAEEGGRIIRLFPGYADSPLWFQNPVPLRRLELAQSLADGLEEWADTFYREIDGNDAADSALIDELDRRGLVLARLLSIEVGRDFTVSVDNFRHGTNEVQGTETATNLFAAAYLTELAAQFRVAVAKTIEHIENMPTVGYRAEYELPVPGEGCRS